MKNKNIIACDDDIHSIVGGELFKLGISADLNHIDTSQVTNFNGLFFNLNFNGDISRWDTSNVVTMNRTFLSSNFNGDISNWDVSGVRHMLSTFLGSKFNNDISNWKLHEDLTIDADLRRVIENSHQTLSYKQVNILKENLFQNNSPKSSISL